MSKHRILQIDAWGNEEGWDWNDYWHVNTFNTKEHGAITEENFLAFMVPDPEHRHVYRVSDDQANLVLERVENDEPLFALEYYTEMKEEN